MWDVTRAHDLSHVALFGQREAPGNTKCRKRISDNCGLYVCAVVRWVISKSKLRRELLHNGLQRSVPTWRRRTSDRHENASAKSMRTFTPVKPNIEDRAPKVVKRHDQGQKKEKERSRGHVEGALPQAPQNSVREQDDAEIGEGQKDEAHHRGLVGPPRSSRAQP